MVTCPDSMLAGRSAEHSPGPTLPGPYGPSDHTASLTAYQADATCCKWQTTNGPQVLRCSASQSSRVPGGHIITASC
jgi:hypothetical protein